MTANLDLSRIDITKLSSNMSTHRCPMWINVSSNIYDNETNSSYLCLKVKNWPCHCHETRTANEIYIWKYILE